MLLAVQSAIDLTEAQQLDLMHLRRLLYGRLGQLLRERKALLSRVHSDTLDPYWTRETVPGAAQVAEQLKANGIAEYKTYMQFASTFFRGVSSPCDVSTSMGSSIHGASRYPRKARATLHALAHVCVSARHD